MISFARSLVALTILSTARASLFVTFPVQGDTCAVSQPCQVKWKDDSKAPSTSTFGETTIDLVMGNASNLQPVQNLGGVSNPAVATALTFTPIAGLSPTQQYAVRFIFKGNQSDPIFSTFFSITGGSGTAKPLSSSNSSTNSPGPLTGNRVSNSTAPASTAPNITSTATNQTASKNASQSSASSIGAPSYAISVMIGLSALFKVL